MSLFPPTPPLCVVIPQMHHPLSRTATTSFTLSYSTMLSSNPPHIPFRSHFRLRLAPAGVEPHCRRPIAAFTTIPPACPVCGAFIGTSMPCTNPIGRDGQGLGLFANGRFFPFFPATRPLRALTLIGHLKLPSARWPWQYSVRRGGGADRQRRTFRGGRRSAPVGCVRGAVIVPTSARTAGTFSPRPH